MKIAAEALTDDYMSGMIILNLRILFLRITTMRGIERV